MVIVPALESMALITPVARPCLAAGADDMPFMFDMSWAAVPPAAVMVRAPIRAQVEARIIISSGLRGWGGFRASPAQQQVAGGDNEHGEPRRGGHASDHRRR